jgi:hypothetical protein
MNRRRLTILSLFLTLVFIQAAPVSAHNPTSINLIYDFAGQDLFVEVFHSVSDTTSHRIAQVIIEKNSVEIIRRDYTRQNSTGTFEAFYVIPAVHGDVLKVTAICSISGQIVGLETVIDPANTDTTPTGTTPLDMTLIIAVAVVVIGIIAVVFALIRRR